MTKKKKIEEPDEKRYEIVITVFENKTTLSINLEPGIEVRNYEIIGLLDDMKLRHALKSNKLIE